MRYCLRFFIPFLILISATTAKAQEEEEDKNWSLSGYVKNLQSVYSLPGPDLLLLDNLIHNRLNFRWYPHENWQVRLEGRNRLFFGNLLTSNPTFAEQIERANNGYFDWSVHIIETDNWLFNSTLDRGYIQYTKGKFEARVGRQRINWGINTVWNPNDIFNAFAFTDFDYEERPGSDAILLRYYTGVASSLEFASNFSRSSDARVIAGLFKTNLFKYDLQLLLGLSGDQLVLGQGWAGNLGNAGFKGEWTWFVADSEPNSVALSSAVDYVFSNSLYLALGYLYNSNGTTSGTLATLFDFELSAQNLYPFKHAILVQHSYPISPLVTASLVWIYSPVEAKPLFVNPSFTFSVAQNWDLDLVAQLSWNSENSRYSSALSAGFLRIKYSF